MTHEKIHASQKWGPRIEITPERIEKMLGEAEKSDYKYKDLYIETLTDWQNGDFLNAVKVHNTIWNERNGNVGKATRMMTDKEQQWYKDSYYR